MMMSFFKKKYINFLISFSNSEARANIYRKYLGIRIGNNVRFTGKPHWGTEPFLIEIGNDVTFTQNISFHTHDGGVGVFRQEYPGINVFGKIRIGNNVFIGSDVTFLPGVTVGNNVVIASGSIVSKDVINNCVIAGVPAKVIKSIDDYKEKVLKNAVYINEKEGVKRRQEILKKIKS